MNSYLSELIELLEAESLKLENAIKECVEDSEYKQAHYHNKALNKVSLQLQTLKNLSDPLYERKRMLERTKIMYSRYTTDPKFAEMGKHLLQELKKEEGELDLEKVQPEQPDSQEIDEAIFELVEQRIKGFRFNLYSESNLYLHFELIDDIIEISFTPFKELTNEHVLYKREKKALKALGFTYSTGKEYMYYNYNVNGFKDAIELKTLLSRIVFDVFFYKNLDSPATIELFS